MLGDVSLFGAFLAGLVSFLSPCVLPLVPAYLSFLGGTSLQEMHGENSTLSLKSRSRIILAAVFFVLGLATIFISLGAVITTFGSAVADYKEVFLRVGGGFIIIFGLHFLGILRIPFLYRQARYESTVEPATLIGAYLMGIFFAFGWTPCVGPILSAILMMAADTATLSKGITMLTAYTIGLGIPFVLAAVSISFFMNFLNKFKQHLDVVEKIMGALLVVIGLLFLFDKMSLLTELFPQADASEGSVADMSTFDKFMEAGKAVLYGLSLGVGFILFTMLVGTVMNMVKGKK